MSFLISKTDLDVFLLDESNTVNDAKAIMRIGQMFLGQNRLSKRVTYDPHCDVFTIHDSASLSRDTLGKLEATYAVRSRSSRSQEPTIFVDRYYITVRVSPSFAPNQPLQFRMHKCFEEAVVNA